VFHSVVFFPFAHCRLPTLISPINVR
jgi:hypothetical protein